MSTAKLKILVIAEAANPEWTSVPLIGWSLSHALSLKFDTHLVTQIRNKDSIERFGWNEGREFTAINSEATAAPFYGLSQKIRRGKNLAWTIATAASSLSYPYFEYLCWKKFKSSLTNGEYDIVHRITPVSPTAPSYLAKRLRKLGVPFIVGPLNGGVAWPNEHRDRLNQEKEWLTLVRNAYKFLPGYKSLRKNSTAIISGSLATQNDLPSYTKDKQFYMPENGIDPKRFSIESKKTFNPPLKAIFIGRLVPYKGIDIAIESISKLAKENLLTLDIFGDGPELNRLQNLINEFDLKENIKLHGFVKNSELQKQIKDSHILLFPSLREFGGGVVLEAMALGVVPLVVDYAGPGELVQDSFGYKVSMGSKDQLIKDIRLELDNILNDMESLKIKSDNAIAEIETMYTWEKKVEQIETIYKWSLTKSMKSK